MKGLAKELLSAWVLLIVLFLVLTHFTGFERDVRAIAAGTFNITKALQGRA